MRGFIYLASAYTHHPGGRDLAFRSACNAVAAIIDGGQAVFSPIAHSHPVSQHTWLSPEDHGIWMEADQPLLDAADEVWVLCDNFDAWRDSRGVANEILRARSNGTPVKYLKPDPEIAHVKDKPGPYIGYELLNTEPSAS